MAGYSIFWSSENHFFNSSDSAQPRVGPKSWVLLPCGDFCPKVYGDFTPQGWTLKNFGQSLRRPDTWVKVLTRGSRESGARSTVEPWKNPRSPLGPTP